MSLLAFPSFLSCGGSERKPGSYGGLPGQILGWQPVDPAARRNPDIDGGLCLSGRSDFCFIHGREYECLRGARRRVRAACGISTDQQLRSCGFRSARAYAKAGIRKYRRAAACAFRNGGRSARNYQLNKMSWRTNIQ